jgi:hypothetical protein
MINTISPWGYGRLGHCRNTYLKKTIQFLSCFLVFHWEFFFQEYGSSVYCSVDCIKQHQNLFTFAAFV